MGANAQGDAAKVWFGVQWESVPAIPPTVANVMWRRYIENVDGMG